jgi:hypothetical protein
LNGTGTNANGKRPPHALSCPCCRTELRTVDGPAGLLYRCPDGHGYTSQGLLAEQARLAARILRDLEASLEAQLAFSAELASRARLQGQRHLLRYLERVMDSGRETLGFVQGRLREQDDF